MRRLIFNRAGVVLLVLGTVMSAACADEPTASAQAPTAASNPDQVVGEVAGTPITLKDVDAKWEEFDAAERARVLQAMYQSRRNMLDQIVGERLIANAAKAAGQSVEAFVEADTVKRLNGETVAETLDRNGLVTVQTPQTFVAPVLRDALGGDIAGAPDCASLVEARGGRIRGVEGDPRLLKVTTPADLELVASWL